MSSVSRTAERQRTMWMWRRWHFAGHTLKAPIFLLSGIKRDAPGLEEMAALMCHLEVGKSFAKVFCGQDLCWSLSPELKRGGKRCSSKFFTLRGGRLCRLKNCSVTLLLIVSTAVHTEQLFVPETHLCSRESVVSLSRPRGNSALL